MSFRWFKGAASRANARTVLYGAFGLALFLAVWAGAAVSLDRPILLPTPLAVVRAFAELLGQGTLIKDTAASLVRVFAGFSAAALVAVPLALVLAYSPALRAIVTPVLALLRPIPPIAWIPLAILWMGLGDPPSYFITAVAAFFPIFINSFAGGLSIQPEHVNAARSLGASPLVLVTRIMLPSALPLIATGLRIGLGQAWMAVVTAELIAAQSGLGYLIQVSRLSLETAHVLVGMSTIGILGAVMIAGLGVIERRFIVPWNYTR